MSQAGSGCSAPQTSETSAWWMPMSGNAPTGGEIPILDQPLDKDSLYQLRASVAAHALQAGLPPRRADDLVIAAHELAANVVRHGSGRGRLRLWRHEQTLHCQVTDEGWQDTRGASDGATLANRLSAPDSAAVETLQPW